MKQPPSTVCIFGTGPQTAEYSRNVVLLQTLRDSVPTVFDCSEPVTHSIWRNSESLLLRKLSPMISTASLLRAWFRLLLHWRTVRSADAIWIPYPSHIDIFLAAALRRRQQRIFMDAFLGLHDTVILDRRILRPDSLSAWLVKQFESFALNLASVVILDTPEHADYLRTQYPLCKARITWIPIGIDETIWNCPPRPSPTRPLKIALWTSFIPLHGISVVVEAARICSDRSLSVRFSLYGDGQTAPNVARQLRETPVPNLEWSRRWSSATEVRDAACSADICLGVFGDSAKADSVIPYKVQEALCAGRMVITADSRACRHLLSDRDSAVLCPAGDPAALADAIQWCADNPDRVAAIARRGHQVFMESLSRVAILERMQIVFAMD